MTFNYTRQSLQNLRIGFLDMRFSVFFFIPQTDRDCFIAFRRNEADRIVEALLSSQQRNDFSLDKAFASASEADEFAVQDAKSWIDNS